MADKELVSLPFGGDGGKVDLAVGDGNLKVQVEYPVVKLLDPIKKNFVDKLKALIPGTWDDALIDGAWSEAVALLAPPAP